MNAVDENSSSCKLCATGVICCGLFFFVFFIIPLPVLKKFMGVLGPLGISSARDNIRERALISGWKKRPNGIQRELKIRKRPRATWKKKSDCAEAEVIAEIARLLKSQRVRQCAHTKLPFG